MAVKANLSWNPFHFLPYDEQVVVNALFDASTEQETIASQCWSIDFHS